jgi:MFS family permease
VRALDRIVGPVCPPRLGPGFRWLVASSWTTNLGDGLALAAGPLLIAAQTDDPLLVASASFVQFLPWVLFGLPAGVLADRIDRRRLLMAVNFIRAAVLVLLGLAVMSGTVNVPIVLGALFLLGTGETFVDVTSSTLPPMIVAPVDLGLANARLAVGHITLNELAGPPLGALLFVAAMASPFLTQAVLVALGAVLIGRITTSTTGAPVDQDHDQDQDQAQDQALPARSGVGVDGSDTRTVRAEIVEGVRWLWHHPPIRTLTLTVVAFNITFGSTIAILVLYARQRLGLGGLGFGLLTTASAVGGILGASSYGWLERRMGMARLMRIGLLIEAATHLTLALTTIPAVAAVILVAFGVHEAVWSTTVTTIRQRAVPPSLQGRVSSVYLMALMAALAVGAALGGVIARLGGITAPLWFAFVGSILILAAIWRQLDHVAQAPQPTG